MMKWVMTMKTAKELWQYISQKGLKPLPKTSVSEWADDYRMISPGLSAEPGRWRTSRAPYQKDIMDAFTQPGVHRVVVKSASQIGKSDIMNNVIGRFAHLDPCAIMMIQPTIDMAQDYSKSRISPMLRDTKVLNAIFYAGKGDEMNGGAKTRDGNNTILSKLFPGGRLIMCGANSPAGLASRPIRVLLADEVDRFPDSAGGEGDPVDLAAKRMTTFWNRTMGLFSTPTNEGASRIDLEYQSGTCEEWQHKCPNCGEYHTIRHTELECNHEDNTDAVGTRLVIVHGVMWRCPSCGFAFDESEMRKTEQKYTAMNPRALANGVRSFFVNCFSSPWITWSDVMKEWLEAQGDPTREQVVMNTRFGESYAQKGVFDSEQQFMNRRKPYGAELPDGVLLLTAAVDTQDNRLEYEIKGWGHGERCWGIFKGVIFGKPDDLHTWEQLDAVLDKPYKFANGGAIKVARTFIDSGGHYTGCVYDYCIKNIHKQRFPINGYAGKPGLELIHKQTIIKRTGGPLITLGVDDGKQQIMNRLSIDVEGPKYCYYPADEEKEGLTNRGYDEAYFKGLISEQKVKLKRGGAVYERWETIGKARNEPLDLSVYNLACLLTLNPNYEALEKAIKGDDEVEASAPAKEKIKKRKPKRSASRSVI